MSERIGRFRERTLEQGRELEPDRRLAAARGAGDLRLEQERQRRELAELAIEVAEHRVRSGVVGPVGETLPHGLGGAGEVAGLAECVADAQPPAGAFGGERAGRGGAPRERDQLVVTPEALIQVGERLGHHRQRGLVRRGRRERGRRALGIGERTGLEARDAEAQRRGRTRIAGELREPRRAAPRRARRDAARPRGAASGTRARARCSGRARAAPSSDAPRARVAEAAVGQLGEAVMEQPRALGLRARRARARGCAADPRADRALVEAREALDHVDAAGLERDRGFEVLGGGGGVAEAVAAQEREALAQLGGVFRRGRVRRAPRARRRGRASRAPARAASAGASRRRARCAVEPAASSASSARASDMARSGSSSRPARSKSSARGVRDRSRVPRSRRAAARGARRCRVRRSARSRPARARVIVGLRLAYEVEQRDRDVRPVEPIEQQLGAAEVEREGGGRERVEPRAASLEPGAERRRSARALRGTRADAPRCRAAPPDRPRSPRSTRRRRAGRRLRRRAGRRARARLRMRSSPLASSVRRRRASTSSATAAAALEQPDAGARALEVVGLRRRARPRRRRARARLAAHRARRGQPAAQRRARRAVDPQVHRLERATQRLGSAERLLEAGAALERGRRLRARAAPGARASAARARGGLLLLVDARELADQEREALAIGRGRRLALEGLEDACRRRRARARCARGPGAPRRSRRRARAPPRSTRARRRGLRSARSRASRAGSGSRPRRAGSTMPASRARCARRSSQRSDLRSRRSSPAATRASPGTIAAACSSA